MPAASALQRCFNLRAHIGFANAAIEISHEDDRGDLLDQRTVAGLQAGSLGVARQRPVRQCWICALGGIDDVPGNPRRLLLENSRQVAENFFR
jgi:hypothetical protein